MTEIRTAYCPECTADVPATDAHRTEVPRRDFLRVVGGAAAALGSAGMFPSMTGVARAAEEAAKPAAAASKPAEALIRELFATLTDDQKKTVVMPWDHGADTKGNNPTRLQTFNAALKGTRIGEAYTKPQQELINRTLRAILSGDEAYERLTRHGKWDSSGSFEGNGVAIFGDPSGDQKFSWMFAGHHLTLRCDGNSEPGAAFGGPMYYGHSANGHSDQNVYNYQTKQVMSVFDMLNAKQQERAIIVGNPGDGKDALRFRTVEARQGVAYSELDESQKKLVTGVLRTLVSPFRKEDGDEVMQLVQANGGMEKVQLAFYKDNAEKGNDRWDAWRLEGPGFIWNYRVLPHVHCFVNIIQKA